MTRIHEIIEVIKSDSDLVTHNKKKMSEIKKHLEGKGIKSGEIESLLSNPERLLNEDIRETALMVEQLYLKSGNSNFAPDQWFTEIEMEEAHKYDKTVFERDYSDMEILFKNAHQIEDGIFSTEIKIKEISELLKAQMLTYDFDIQREATKRKGSLKIAPTIVKKNVKEMKAKILSGKLRASTIVFNALVGSHESGQELAYDDSQRTLLVKKGTELAVLDGWHRCMAAVAACEENPDINFKFILTVTNFTKREAQRYQADHAKMAPISKTRVEMFEASRMADTVTQYLMDESDLKDRISSKHSPSTGAGELVSYSIITDAIEQEFPMEFKRDAKKVGEYLSEFFEELIAEYSDEIFNNKKSLMGYNKIFAGYVALAAEMMKKSVEVEELGSVLKGVDFSRDNPVWKEIGIIGADGNIKPRVNEKKIMTYFKELI